MSRDNPSTKAKLVIRQLEIIRLLVMNMETVAYDGDISRMRFELADLEADIENYIQHTKKKMDGLSSGDE